MKRRVSSHRDGNGTQNDVLETSEPSASAHDASAVGISRRAALQGLGIGLGTVALGCGDDVASAVVEESETIEGIEPPATGVAPSEPILSDEPAPSPPKEEGPKLSPEELLSGVEHIVVLMMENRSFDHYLGALTSDSIYANKANVDGLTGTESNPAPDGASVSIFKMFNFTPADPPHEWHDAHEQFNGGLNDGFVKVHAGPHQHEAMGFHDRSQIPLYYWFADNFAICDQWFSSVMGPTWPNRFYLHAATARGTKGNTPIFSTPNTIWDELARKKLSAKNYAAGITTWIVGGFPAKILNGNPSAPISQFFEAARTGTLPAFSLIDPDYLASDDHPSHNIQRGQAFVASVYKALSEGPLWPKTLFIITYDENGGFYDHVPPPKTADDEEEFRQLGFRVPSFVIGPMVKKGYVCKKLLEHSSVAATLKTRWGISNLSTRMNVTNDVSDCIDPLKVKAPAPAPAGMPQVAMSMRSALYDGVGVSSQPMLEEMVAAGIAPVVDPRSDQERIASWLEHAVRLGAVRIVGD